MYIMLCQDTQKLSLPKLLLCLTVWVWAGTFAHDRRRVPCFVAEGMLSHPFPRYVVPIYARCPMPDAKCSKRYTLSRCYR